MPSRHALLAVLCGVVLWTASGGAQEPAPARLSFSNIARGREPVELTFAWRFHRGDDPRWGAPSFDDAGWEIVDPRMPRTSRPRGGWPGTGWFRRHILVTGEAPSGQILLGIEAPGQASVYLDGVLVMEKTRHPAGLRTGVVASASTTVALPRGPHVLAVRYLCECASRDDEIGFLLTLDLPELRNARGVGVRRDALISGMFVAIPAVLGLLHLTLYFYYRKARENLFCALCMLSLAVVIGASIAEEFANDRTAVAMLLYAGIAAATFFGLMTYAVIRIDRIPRTWIGFAIAGAALPLAAPFLEGTAANIAWALYFVASLVEIVRIEIRERTVERESAFPLFVGMLLLDAAILLQILISFGLIPAPFGFDAVYLFGVLAFSLSTSLFVARSFARTSLHLERRLAEVQALSTQMIATERESARRGLEIDAARTLQRSILPLTIPQLPRLEIAATVTTASEVGGDYYDFRVGGDGSVTIAVGDAAGHGVAAGAMVTATKALFSALEDEENLPTILARCDRVLRGMNVKPLHMCLLLARVTPQNITVSSAAMPTPLHFRAATGTVEEIAVGGLPLAAGLRPSWLEETRRLDAGDVLLFASDGLAEALSADGDPMGYPRVAALFASSAPRASAGEIIDTLLAEAESWRGSREQNDDIAIVVLRVREA